MTRCFAFALLALALPTGAQTTDGLWRHWTSREESVTPRAAALGGADVTLPDDAAQAVTNPALLATLWRTEVIAGAGRGQRFDFTQLQAARWSPDGVPASVYLRRPVSGRARSASDRLDSELTEGGAVFARRVGQRLSLGAGVTLTRLTLSGESSTATAGGARVRAGVGADSTRLGASLGVAWHDHAWTLGAALRTGTTFEATRTSTLNGAWDDRGSVFGVRRPWRLVVGGSYRPSLRLSLFGQADVRGAGLLQAAKAPTLAQSGGAAAQQAGSAAMEAERGGLAALRAGAQYALALERVSLVFRAGVARLNEAGARTAATTAPAQARIAAASAKTRVTAGVGLAWELSALDLAYDGAGRWTVEARVRLWR